MADSTKIWKQEEIAVLREHYCTSTPEELCALLPGRTYEAIKTRAKMLKMARPVAYWTPEEDELVRRLYPNHENAVIAERLGRSLKSIADRAQVLKVNKTAAFLSAQMSARIKQRKEAQGDKAGTFKRTGTPTVPGQKMNTVKAQRAASQQSATKRYKVAHLERGNGLNTHRPADTQRAERQASQVQGLVPVHRTDAKGFHYTAFVRPQTIR